MNSPEYSASNLQFDENGLLVHPEHWSRSVALQIAAQYQITDLTQEHWKIIDALRKHYARFGVAPAMHNICHANHKSRDWIHSLFGNCLNAWRVAGLPDPGEEAKSYLSDM